MIATQSAHAKQSDTVLKNTIKHQRKKKKYQHTHRYDIFQEFYSFTACYPIEVEAKIMTPSRGKSIDNCGAVNGSLEEMQMKERARKIIEKIYEFLFRVFLLLFSIFDTALGDAGISGC